MNPSTQSTRRRSPPPSPWAPVAVGLLLLLGLACSSRGISNAEEQQERPASRTAPRLLSQGEPRLVIPIAKETWAQRPPVLELRILTIQNPLRTPFSVRVSLQAPPREPLLLGSITPFPLTQPGSFWLPASEAFEALTSLAPFGEPSTQPPILTLELVSIHGDPLPDLEITLALPEWRDAP